MLRYTLLVVTHGVSPTLEACLASFVGQVKPTPARVLIAQDATGLGFCENTRRGWQLAAGSDAPYVFWLEHDFIFSRTVELGHLAVELEDDPMLAQMALLRGPANDSERAAGGIIESRPGEFERLHGWFRQQSFFTTNPSLMRTAFMRENPWPDHRMQCEGRFGLDLVGRGYRFGMWGEGEPWIDHVGVRYGHGY